MSSLWKTTAWVNGSCHCHQSWSTSRDLVDINRPKIRRYTRYLRNLNRPLGLPGHRRWFFWRWQWVISLNNDGASPWQLLLPSVVEHVTTVSILRNTCYFACSFCRLFCRLFCKAAFRIFHNTNTHHRRGSNEEAEVDTCNPSRKVILVSHAGTSVARKISVFCLCVILVYGVILFMLFNNNITDFVITKFAGIYYIT